MKEFVSFQTQNLHLDTGEIVPGWVGCAPEQPLEIRLGHHPESDITFPDEVHIALARADTHVHFRESYVPSREEFETDPYHFPDMSYENLLEKIKSANARYDAWKGSLAALKGGVWLVGAMGNTPWAPVGEARWGKMDDYYRRRSLVFTHVWPRMEPGVPPVVGQEEKDFGSTFGGSGLSAELRRRMYQEHRGGMVSYHNDQDRPGEDLLTFRERVRPPDALLHSLYYDGGTVYAMQRETLLLALDAKLRRLLTRHIPTGPALDMILRARSGTEMELPAEVGLDYLYFNRELAAEHDSRLINYRRPAHPSREDQAALIELTRDCARLRDPLTFFGSDHAPHDLAAKAFKANGLPGSPGTRVIEHTHQIHMHLMHQAGYTFDEIDWLAAVVPARYLAQYRAFPLPVAAMENGAMANLVIFHPDVPYPCNEAALRMQLHDPHYHSAYRGERLRGQVLYTVVHGVVYDVQGNIIPLNKRIESLVESG